LKAKFQSFSPAWNELRKYAMEKAKTAICAFSSLEKRGSGATKKMMRKGTWS
jgi:hypothetical protein